MLRCDCGNEYVAALKSLLSKNARGKTRVRSCGCLLREVVTAGTKRTHGLTHHPLYHTWQMMLRRCENPDDDDYFRYGGRGIKVCDRWHDAVLFTGDIESEIGSRPEGRHPSGHPLYTLDRIDNDGDYEPGNVRWATQAQQALNSRPRGTC